MPKVICQRCGFQYLDHQLRKEWTGLRVCKACWDPRHPQDFVRGVKERVPTWTSPEPPAVYITNVTIGNMSGDGSTITGAETAGTNFIAQDVKYTNVVSIAYDPATGTLTNTNAIIGVEMMGSAPLVDNIDNLASFTRASNQTFVDFENIVRAVEETDVWFGTASIDNVPASTGARIVKNWALHSCNLDASEWAVEGCTKSGNTISFTGTDQYVYQSKTDYVDYSDCVASAVFSAADVGKSVRFYFNRSDPASDIYSDDIVIPTSGRVGYYKSHQLRITKFGIAGDAAGTTQDVTLVHYQLERINNQSVEVPGERITTTTNKAACLFSTNLAHTLEASGEVVENQGYALSFTPVLLNEPARNNVSGVMSFPENTGSSWSNSTNGSITAPHSNSGIYAIIGTGTLATAARPTQANYSNLSYVNLEQFLYKAEGSTGNTIIVFGTPKSSGTYSMSAHVGYGNADVRIGTTNSTHSIMSNFETFGGDSFRVWKRMEFSNQAIGDGHRMCIEVSENADIHFAATQMEAGTNVTSLIVNYTNATHSRAATSYSY